MKVNLKYLSHSPNTDDYLLPHNDGLHSIKKEQHPTRSQPSNRAEFHSTPWRTATNNTWNSVLPDSFLSAKQHCSDTCSLNRAKKSLPSMSRAYAFNVLPSPTLSTLAILRMPTPTPDAYTPDSWLFSFSTRELRNTTNSIQLTAIESLLVRTLTLSSERICSKQELILGIDKDADTYSGLEMCLSRLQSKFKATFSERLFRSVRNRGYCLVQEVHSTH